MKNFLSLILILAVSAAALAAVPAADVKKVAVDNNKFACDLYAKLQGDDSANLFFSPYSISTALGMTMAGARGETEKQMATVLHFSMSQEKLHPALKALAESLKSGAEKKAYELSIANALWGQKGYEIKKPFLDLMAANYGAGFKQVDFISATEESRKTINGWVEKETKDKIKELFKPKILDDSTRLVLTNAIYFKGTWRYQFKAADTHDAWFKLALKSGQRVSETPEVKAPLMYQKGEFRLFVTDSMQVLDLPYGPPVKDNLFGKEKTLASMMVILPNTNTVEELAGIEKSLSAETIQKWAETMTSEDLAVYLPKFKMTCEFSLNKTLMALGMKDAFRMSADFTGMTKTPDLYIAAVVHKAFVDVNEEGTEAAAATGVSLHKAMAPTFRADHPFIFLIRDNATGSILFMGRCMNPTK